MMKFTQYILVGPAPASSHLSWLPLLLSGAVDQQSGCHQHPQNASILPISLQGMMSPGVYHLG